MDVRRHGILFSGMDEIIPCSTWMCDDTGSFFQEWMKSSRAAHGCATTRDPISNAMTSSRASTWMRDDTGSHGFSVALRFLRAEIIPCRSMDGRRHWRLLARRCGPARAQTGDAAPGSRRAGRYLKNTDTP